MVTGEMTSEMDTALKHKLMDRSSRATFLKVISKEKVLLNGQMELSIQETGQTIRWKDKEPKYGQMADSILASGK